jgi:hypothetical protein
MTAARKTPDIPGVTDALSLVALPRSGVAHGHLCIPAGSDPTFTAVGLNGGFGISSDFCKASVLRSLATLFYGVAQSGAGDGMLDIRRPVSGLPPLDQHIHMRRGAGGQSVEVVAAFEA